MVTVGDAFHNFADGLDIGEVLSFSIAAGSLVSSSLAVFCHGLPHEVGDFGLILHSGMAIKTAVLFYIAPSIFAIIGMVAGLVMGSLGQFSSWLLASRDSFTLPCMCKA